MHVRCERSSVCMHVKSWNLFTWLSLIIVLRRVICQRRNLMTFCNGLCWEGSVIARRDAARMPSRASRNLSHHRTFYARRIRRWVSRATTSYFYPLRSFCGSSVTRYSTMDADTSRDSRSMSHEILDVSRLSSITDMLDLAAYWPGGFMALLADVSDG